MCLGKPFRHYSSTVDYYTKYFLAKCIIENSYVNPTNRERLCDECFASEPIFFKRRFVKLDNRHYTSVGHRRPRLRCFGCARYLGIIQTISNCQDCEGRFLDYLLSLSNEGIDFFDQRDPTLLA